MKQNELLRYILGFMVAESEDAKNSFHEIKYCADTIKPNWNVKPLFIDKPFEALECVILLVSLWSI